MQTSKTDVELLLTQVKTITEHYDKLALERGDKFNVFDIIGLRNSEVKMHSAMLRNLLDVNGSHGMKERFLDLFIEELNTIKSLKDKDFSHNLSISESKAKAEEYAGEKGETEGGRIDLYIYDKQNNAIIVENKIYAGEQENQLIRYNNYNSDAPIIFLTLEGDKPHSFKIEKTEIDISEKVFCVSYRTNIINWLKKCHKESADKPLLREGIKHYINLIKILTNQTIDNEMEKDLLTLLTDTKNINSVLKIIWLGDEIKIKITRDYFNLVLEDFESIDLPNDLGFKGTEIIIKRWLLKNDSLKLILYFCNKFNILTIGLHSETKENSIYKKYFDDYMKTNCSIKDEDWVIYHDTASSIYDNIEWGDLLNNDTIINSKNTINKIVNEVDRLIRQIH